ncbi:phosphate/phosphite/phosphonate ABC transporter substrate-binding protein [Paraherbaspirillum soli]|uniref:Phosphate/phosphite/phosphonate ABC transporter substrate-binding protein n=1 Tax=Paraherbaspirillum soli TaxID=631222 RepID=A0ABW0M8D2_9BURK
MKNLLKIALVLGSLATSFAFAEDASKKITVGLIATTTPEDTQKRWQPMLDELAKSTKMEVRTVVSSNYSDIVAGLKSNTIQVAWLSSKSALEAVEDGQSTVFAQMVKKDGSRGYNSVLITPQASPIKSFEDLVANKGKYSFADGEKSSTSGYLVPAYYAFSKNKVEPEKLFSKISVGNHKKNLLAVINGEVDVATNNTEELDRIKTEAPAQFKKVRVIWTSPLIANDPILYRKDLPPDVQKKVKDFFTTYGKQKGGVNQAEVLQKILDLSGFQNSSDAQLKPIADLTMFGLLRSNMYDASLSTAQKQAAFDKITARFGKLDAALEMARSK